MAASSGCYLLAVVAEPISEDHKQIILQRLNKGLLSWDVSTTGCDLDGLGNICSSVKDKETQDDLLIQYSTESLGVEVLVNPPVNTLKQCVKNLLTSTIGHKHIIHAGYTFTGSGSWILQNGTYSFEDFRNAFIDAKAISPRGSTIHIHCVEEGDWTSENLSKEVFTKIANVSLNPSDKIDHLPGSEHLVDCLESVLTIYSLTEIMEASPLVGNIRFNRPTLYLFPAGEGDCALFGINGFNMLVDGGFNRKPCSWEFIRHLDRLDAVLVTRLSESNLCSMSTLMKRKTLNNTYPQIGYVFCNIAEGKSPSPTEELQKDRNDLLVSVVGEGHKFIHTLTDLKLMPHQSWRDSTSEPFVLYHKVGHGTLEMHILSPPKDSKEMKDFLSEWSEYKEKFSCVKFKGQMAPIPLSHATSICAILVWRPNDPKDTITRILFSGSAPQSKIFEGLDKLKGLDILKHPTVTKSSLNAVILSKPKPKSAAATPVSKSSVPNRRNTASPALSVSSVASRNGDIAGMKKEIHHMKDNRAVKDVKKVVKDIKKELKPAKEVKKESKEIKETKKEVKKETKEVKKEPKKESKPAIEKVAASKPAVKKSETLKAASDMKKPAAKKIVKKEVTTKASPSVKAADKEIKKTKTAETKTAKEVINKKAAEAKTTAKPKSKPTHAAASAGKTKPTPVPKSPSKITRAIAASAAVATAAVAVGVAEFIESKREEDEKEEVLNVEIEEKVVSQSLQNGVVEADVCEPIPASPLRQETMSPALSEPVSLTASDTLSSAPMETVSPTPPQEIISPTEEKEVNEIKEVDLQTPTDDEERFPEQEAPEKEQTPVFDHDEIESAVDEGIVDDNVEEKPNTQTIVDSEGTIEGQDDAGYDASTDLMTTSFMGESVEPVEEKIISESVTQSQAVLCRDDDIHAEELEDAKSEEPAGENVPAVAEEHIEISKTEDKTVSNIDLQFASASMEGSFCAGLQSEDQGDKPQDEDSVQNIVTSDSVAESELVSNVMETSMVLEQQDDEITEDYVQQVINQYKEVVGEVDEDVSDDKIPRDDHLAISESTENKPHIVAEAENELDDKPSYDTERFDNQVSSSIKDEYEGTIDASNETKAVQEGLIEKSDQFEVSALSTKPDFQDSLLGEHTDEVEENECAQKGDELVNESNINEYSALKEGNQIPEIDIEREVQSSFAYQTFDDEAKEVQSESDKQVDYQTSVIMKEDDNTNIHSTENPDISVPFEHGDVTGIDEEKAAVDGMRDEDPLKMEDEYEQYSAEEKQDSDEKDHDSAEDEEVIRHPTPPGGQEFYQQIGPRDDDMKDPISQHFIAPSAFRNKGKDQDEPLYEEPEDSSSERSRSPVVEQPVFSSTDKADYPELVTVSGGTTPSEPESPKSPYDNKKGHVAALEVMEALSEQDCSESSTQSPLVHDDPNAFDHAVESHVQDIGSCPPEVPSYEEGGFHEVKDKSSEAYTREDSDTKLGGDPRFHEDESKVDHIPPSEDLHDFVRESAAESEMHYDSQHETPNEPEIRYDLQQDAVAESEMRCDSEHDAVDKSEIRYDSQHDPASESEVSYESHRDAVAESEMHYVSQEATVAESKISYDSMPDADAEPEMRCDSQHEAVAESEKLEKHYDSQHEVVVDSEIHYDSQHDAVDELKMQCMSSHEADVECEKHYDSPRQAGIESELLYDQRCQEVESEQNYEHHQVVESEQNYERHQVVESEQNYEHHEAVPESEMHYNTRRIEAESELLSDPSKEAFNESQLHSDVTPETLAEAEMHSVLDKSVVESEMHLVENCEIAAPDAPPAFSCETAADNYEKLKTDVYDKESDLVYEAESEQFAIKLESSKGEQFSTNQDFYTQEFGTSEENTNLKDFHSQAIHLNECGIEAEAIRDLSDGHHESNDLVKELDSSEIDTGAVSVPAEFSNTYDSEGFKGSDKLDGETSEAVEPYAFESSAYVNESSYQYQTETIEQNNRYSSASTVELDNSKHSSENVSNIEPFETEGQCGSPYAERYQDHEEQQIEQTKLVEQSECLTSEETESHSVSRKDDYGHSDSFTDQEHYRPNGFSGVSSEMSAVEDDRDFQRTEAPPPPSGINGQDVDSWKMYSNDFTGVEITRNNGGYNSTFSEVGTVKVASSEQQASYIIESHYHSDSPEDNSMKNDSPPDVPSPVDPEQIEDPLNPLPTAPPEGYDGINNKFISPSEGYAEENFNYSSTLSKPTKNKYSQEGENPYGESSEDDDSSSLPGNVSPYAYTNKAYNQEDDVDGNHIYKQPFRIEQNTDASKLPPTFDVNNPHTFSESTTFDSHVSPGVTYSSGYPDMNSADPSYDFRLEEWGKPMGLPTPPEPPSKTAKKAVKTTPTSKSLTKSAEKRSSLDNGKATVAAKLNNSPLKKAKESESEGKPIYVDLAYVPHHGDSNYSDVEFFRKIRARYYVFSGISPSKEVLNALLEAKKSWKEDLEVTIIPTYETDTLGYWLAQNQDTLAEYSIEVAPSASRCTVNLQDHETSCAAYRLEF